MAARLTPPFRRPVWLALAGVLEDAGRVGEAEAVYERQLADTPDDPLASLGLERTVTARTEPASLLAEKQRAARETTTERARARLLEELLLLEPVGPRTLEWARELSALEPAHALAARVLERDAMQRDDQAELLALTERAQLISRAPLSPSRRASFRPYGSGRTPSRPKRSTIASRASRRRRAHRGLRAGAERGHAQSTASWWRAGRHCGT